MVYDFNGRILSISKRQGTSAKGPWEMWEVVIEHDTTGQYPRRVLVSVWDDNVKNTVAFCYQQQTPIHATASIDARENNGRWFNDIRVFRAEQQQAQPMQQQYQAAPMQQPGFVAPAAPTQQTVFEPQAAPMQQPANPAINSGTNGQGAAAYSNDMPF